MAGPNVVVDGPANAMLAGHDGLGRTATSGPGGPLTDTVDRRPGPIRCYRCGHGWERRAAFLPVRHLDRDDGWPWICVSCFVAEHDGATEL